MYSSKTHNNMFPTFMLIFNILLFLCANHPSKEGKGHNEIECIFCFVKYHDASRLLTKCKGTGEGVSRFKPVTNWSPGHKFTSMLG